MSKEDLCCSTQLIDENGEFNVEGLEKFVERVRLAEYGLSYAVVSIMGPQSSGKSTLLNHLFNTNFREMNAFKGRSQTTKGIWIAKCPGIEPCTIVMDLEGTDGRERGEDDTTFEKQSALFALAISDIVLINMWCHDIGREQAANRPLLKTVFRVMMRLFTPRKTTLLFVIRDKTKTPLEYLEHVLREDIQKIWDNIPMSQAHKDTSMSEFFNVKVTALASYEEKEEQFKDQVAQLRQLFFHSIAPGGLAGDRRGVVPASGFSFSAQQIWKVIRENKDLDLPAHKVMVATVRCEEIANEKLRNMASNEAWLELEASVQSGPVMEFGKKVGLILNTFISEYDAETIYFDEEVRTSKRKQLEYRALQLVYPSFQSMLGHLRHMSLENFKKLLELSLKDGKWFALSVRECRKHTMNEFERCFTDLVIQHANWDAVKTREKLHQDIETHAKSVCSAKLSELKIVHEKQLYEALAIPIGSLFDTGGHDTWLSIRKLYKRETENVLSSFLSLLSGFELDPTVLDSLATEFRNYARSVVEKKARQEAGKVLSRMKDRFTTVFSHDSDSMPRIWTGKEDIRAITKNARASALKLLSALTVIRLDDEKDNIENILQSTLLEGKSFKGRGIRDSTDPLSSNTWDGVNPKNMLISPVQCKTIWRQFNAETEYIVTQAISAQEAYKRNNNWLPPPWAILAIAILGFNEFMMLLRNPFYIMVLFILYLLSKALWVQLDISGEFRHGPFSGLIALAARFLPSVMNLLRKLADLGQIHHQPSASNLQRFRSQSTMQNTIADSISASSTLSTLSSNDAEIESTGSLTECIQDKKI